MGLFAELREELATYLDSEQIASIEKAYKLADLAHKGQKRQTGEPYITHPVAAAKILAQLRMDYQSIMAALLHDTLEDTIIDKASLAHQFGDEVAELVDGVSKLAQIPFENRAEAQAENFRKMILAMVRDIRVILVKLADRLHNMRTLDALDNAKRKRIAIETIEIYAAIANRLGMHSLRLELEDLGFCALFPHRSRVLKAAVRRARGNRKEIMTTIETAIKTRLEATGLPPCAVWGREKHLYSIYRKMRTKHLSFNEIMDVYGFRIVTDSVDTSYRVLGAVHGLYKPVPERFKDYIAIPKANGYQSLHTTLFGPYGVPIEIQIRTVDMDNLADYGIAAHWLYKTEEDRPGEIKVNTAQIRARQWLKSLLEMQQSTGNSLEFVENVKIDLFPDEVYVFTPKGRILELPSGATPVDFAYAVHSDVGNTCVAAKIDRRLAPLSTTLSNGQTVEIITAPGARPNTAWLSFVITGKARSNIRHFLKSQRRVESITLGQNMLHAVLSTLNLSWDSLRMEIIDELLRSYHERSLDDLLEAIGLGNILPLAVARRLAEVLDKENANVNGKDIISSELAPVPIRGSEGMVLNFASCCRPIPGDPILGLVQPGQGLIVHMEDCRAITKFRYDRDKCLPLEWHQNIQGEFKVDIELEVANQRGVLAQLTTAIAAAEANIDNINSHENDGSHYNLVTITLSVHDRAHLAKVLKRIRNIKSINVLGRRKN